MFIYVGAGVAVVAKVVIVSRLQKRGERYVIEIPKDMLDKVLPFHGKPLKVTIDEIV